MKPRLLIAYVLAVAALAVGISACGSDDPQAPRSAAGVDGVAMPTTAYFGTAGLDATASKIVACTLPSGPCRDIQRLGTTDARLSAVSGLDYADGQLFALGVTGITVPRPQRVVACDLTATPVACRTLVALGPSYDVSDAGGPVYMDGRVLITRWPDSEKQPSMYSCDPETTQSLGDCTVVALERPVLDFRAVRSGEIIGIAASRGARSTEVVACSVGSGACRQVGSLPAEPYAISYIPQFDRAYFGVGDNEMWACTLQPGACSRLNAFGSSAQAFAGLGDRVFTGTDETLRACAPATADDCPSVRRELGVRTLAAYGESDLLVGTNRKMEFDASRKGGLYLRSVDGSTGSTIWPDQAGGVLSMVTDANITLRTTVVRFTPRGSGVTATGTVTVSPAPASGVRACVLGAPERPVTCPSMFPRGTRVTLAAEPGPQSELNTWKGAAEQCNEAAGPGTPPALTCTITLADLVTEVTAGFRPASTPPDPATTP